jgi:hypothetical protein
MCEVSENGTNVTKNPIFGTYDCVSSCSFNDLASWTPASRPNRLHSAKWASEFSFHGNYKRERRRVPGCQEQVYGSQQLGGLERASARARHISDGAQGARRQASYKGWDRRGGDFLVSRTDCWCQKLKSPASWVAGAGLGRGLGFGVEVRRQRRRCRGCDSRRSGPRLW